MIYNLGMVTMILSFLFLSLWYDVVILLWCCFFISQKEVYIYLLLYLLGYTFFYKQPSC